MYLLLTMKASNGLLKATFIQNLCVSLQMMVFMLFSKTYFSLVQIARNCHWPTKVGSSFKTKNCVCNLNLNIAMNFQKNVMSEF
jgi:hypothetical protein